MSTVATPAPEAQPPITLFARIVGVLFNPKRTFEDIARRPSWVTAVVILSVIWLCLNAVLVQRVDWVETSRQQIEKNKFAASRIEQLKPEEREAAYEKGAAQAKVIRYVRGVIGWPLLVLIYGGIYLGSFKLLGGARVNFRQSLSVSAYAFIPLGLRELLAIPVSLLKDPGAIDPDNFLASNLGAFLPAGAPFWQIVLGASFDVFLLWSLALVAVGFSAADPKKISLRKGMAISFGLWAALTLFFSGLLWILF